MDKYLDILRQNWGFEDFRGIQREIIESIGAGHDTLGLMPTGGGKSITFQVPALAQPGLCLVITPLIALMKDQVEHLRMKGIKAAAIYTGMTHEKIIITLENCIFGDYKFLYISPERLKSELFLKKVAYLKISFICIDEAHCISQWGYDFRPSYLDINSIRKLLPETPVLALTATATPQVVDDIQKQLHFRQGNVFRMSFTRQNLAYKVKKTFQKEDELKRILDSHKGSTIIYSRNRIKCEKLSKQLVEWGYSATYYHAGLSNAEKDTRQRNWQNDKTRIIVATNAFGMGIDKPDVRLVLHLGIPDAIESYFQEAGRAGRDGNFAEAMMLYDSIDLRTLNRRVNECFPKKQLIADIYEQVCCYLEIAIGFGQGRRKEFNIVDFCEKFGHFSTTVENALMLLTKAGYIEYSDAEESISRVQILIKRDELYHITDEDKNQDLILQSLFRQYTGLFVKPIQIDESYIAKNTGLTESQVYHTLKKLGKRKIIKFIPRKNIPHITFTLDRQEKNRIHLSKKIYEERKENLEERINAMIEYVSQDDTCRSKYLLSYFGEKSKQECGICDICIENTKAAHPLKQIVNSINQIFTGNKTEEKEKEEAIKKEIKEEIISQLKIESSILPFQLELSKYDPEQVREVVKEMTDNEEIEINSNLQLQLTRKKNK